MKNQNEEIVQRLVSEKDQAIAKLQQEKDDLINNIQTEHRTTKEQLVSQLRNEH